MGVTAARGAGGDVVEVEDAANLEPDLIALLGEAQRATGIRAMRRGPVALPSAPTPRVLAAC